MNRPWLERVLDTPQRWVERGALSPDVKLLLLATIRYVKQIARSRSPR